jgi:hypothetical protein
MNENNPSCLVGLLSMERLFLGSKSEGLYPVLHANDGKQYRLHRKTDLSLDEKTLSDYDGKRVQVIGNADNLRGHWRLVLAVDSLPQVLEVVSIHSHVSAGGDSQAASVPIPAASGEGRLEAVAQDLVHAQPSATQTRPKE